MPFKKKKKSNVRYIPLADIEKINSDFLDEMERVKKRLNFIKVESEVNAFYEVLLGAYNAAIETKTLEREVDYEVKLAEIKERRRNLKPWRRCWLWRLLFKPLTNRAQDVIEERAEVEADIAHSRAEEETAERVKLLSDKERERYKSLMRDKLAEVIKQADNADVQEAFDEPSEPAGKEKPTDEQLSIDVMPTGKRPRPPRSCRA